MLTNPAPLSIFLLVATVQAAERPNILFIFADDHATQAISAYGSRLLATPNIDRIAERGAIFRNSFCGNSICAPSRATVLTGKHSHANGKRTNLDHFDGGQMTFPKLLAGAGYQTALIGKWHLRDDPQGFDHWEVLRGQGTYYNPDLVTAAGEHRYTGYTTDIITDRALEWLDQRDRQRPFLLMCQHKAPHRTWAPAPRHLSLFADHDLPEPATLFDDYAGRSPLLARNEMSIRDYFYWDYDMKVPDSGLPDPFDRGLKSPEVKRMTPEQRAAWDAAYAPRNRAFLDAGLEGDALVRWKYQRYVKDYLRCVKAVDENVGRLLDALQAHGLLENTLVVYSSDQGFYLGEHGWYDKRWMFEESLAMPLLMSWPGRIVAGSNVEELVQNIDHAPTFLAAAGLEAPKEMQGTSLLGLVDGSRPQDERELEWRDAIYYTYYELGEHNVPRHDGVRTERYKLMLFPDTAEWQLFDLKRDPRELRSVHDQRAYATVFEFMKRKLVAERKRYGASPWPLPPEDPPTRGIVHVERELQGWTIHVDDRLLGGEHEKLGRQALDLIEGDLRVLALRLKPAIVERLRRVPVWLDLDHPLTSMQYHLARDADWLPRHGYDKAMEGSVHLPSAASYVAEKRRNAQPWVLLHELAHSYHDQELSFDHPEIRARYDAIVESGIYDEVLHIGGKRARHYALTNRMEFFAEMTEAFLGTNDFFPFVRAELAEYDPETFALMRRIWE